MLDFFTQKNYSSGATSARQRTAAHISSGYPRGGGHLQVVFPLAERAAHHVHDVGQLRSHRRHVRRDGRAELGLFPHTRFTAAQSRYSGLRHSPPSAVTIVMIETIISSCYSFFLLLMFY